MPRRAKKSPRRCVLCRKPGHNAARCLASSEALTAPVNACIPAPSVAPRSDVLLTKAIAPADPRPAPGPLKFFIHHVAAPPPASTHYLDLKTETTKKWSGVESAGPLPVPVYPVLKEAPALPDVSIQRPRNFVPRSTRVTPRGLARPRLAAALKRRARDWPSRLTGAALRWYVPKLSRPALRSLAVAALGLLIIPFGGKLYTSLLIAKYQVLGPAATGAAALRQAFRDLIGAEFARAAAQVTIAEHEFGSALYTLTEQHELLYRFLAALPLAGETVNSRANLIMAGQNLALGTDYLLTSLQFATAEATPWLTRLAAAEPSLNAALKHFVDALNSLNQISGAALPEELQGEFTAAHATVQNGVADLTAIRDLGALLPELFGGQGQRRYLVVFQNPHELRPTGGFMGSFAILTVKDGRLVSFVVPPGGSYDLQGQLDVHRIPPLPLLLANARWEFQDANWWPDFPASAQKILWFYRHARGESADGVIAINATVLPKLLSLVGPIPLPERQLTLDSASALESLTASIAGARERAPAKPKQILTEAAPALLAKLADQSRHNPLPLLQIFEESLRRKEIQLFMTDAASQALVHSFGWDGSLLATSPDQDYLMVVAANIQGQKSDAHIAQTIDHQVVVAPGGTATVTVTVRRSHGGSANQSVGGHDNIIYLRLYVPLNSTLLTAGGFSSLPETAWRAPSRSAAPDESLGRLEEEVGLDAESGTRVTREFGKTAFGNWVITKPGETSEVVFSYRLPWLVLPPAAASPPSAWSNLFKTNPIATYQLVVQPQSGAPVSFGSALILPASWKPIWKQGPGVELALNGALISPQPLEENTVWSVLLKQKN